MMRVGLTLRQLDMLEYLQDFIDREGHAPTYEQMAAHLGVTKAFAHALVSGLITRGYVERLPNRPRAIALVKDPKGYPKAVEKRIAEYCRRNHVDRDAAVARAVECFFGGAA